MTSKALLVSTVLAITLLGSSFGPVMQANAQVRQWREIFEYSGTSPGVTPPFTIEHPPWRVTWTFTPLPSTYGYFAFQVVPGPVGFGGGTGAGEQTDSVQFVQVGTFYLSIISSSGLQSWKVVVEEFS